MIAVLSENVYMAFEAVTGIKSYPLKDFKNLSKPVASHADMLICVIEDNVFCYKDYYLQNCDTFNAIEKEGYTITKVEHCCFPTYPKDIGLNVLIMGKTIFCKIKNVAKEIIEFAQLKNYKIVDVKQGYSCCSTFVLSDNTAITADMGMKKAIENDNKRVILIKGNKIKLKGYSCGFIGGCGGVKNQQAYFFGKYFDLDDYKKISEALQKEKINFVSILSGDVCDFGGIKFFG